MSLSSNVLLCFKNAYYIRRFEIMKLLYCTQLRYILRLHNALLRLIRTVLHTVLHTDLQTTSHTALHSTLHTALPTA